MSEVALSLIVLHSADMERTVRFYALLGLEFRRERHGTGPEHFAARIGSAVLEVYPQVGDADSVGLRLGFRVTSVDRVIEAVHQANGSVITPPRSGLWGYRAVLADPDGRRIEVTE